MEDMLALVQQFATDEEQRRALECELSFHAFVREFFPVIEPATTYADNWHIDCIGEHLQAATAGEITRIIFNIPPRHMKSILISVMWNAWEWIANPSLRYLHATYAESLSLRDSAKTMAIVNSPKYQRWYGHRFHLTKQQAKVFWTDRAGYRLASSVGGSNTGEGGERIVIDDPHNAKERNSDAMRSGVLDWYDNVMSSRFNDPKTSIMAVIMQRVHHQDLTGHLLAKGSFVHVMLPAEFEIARRCVTKWGSDKRKEEGELLWPDRFGANEIASLKVDLGTYGSAGQLQQRPAPEGGGMVSINWFKRYSAPPMRLRRTTFSIDCANKKTNANAWNVIEVWGEDMDGMDCLLAVYRFRAEYPELRRIVISHFLKWSPEAVLIEDKANGIALIQDLREPETLRGIARQMGVTQIPMIPCIPIEPEGDKVTRMSIESPYIEAGGCALPTVAAWLPEFELEISMFPNSTFMDQIDTLSQYLMWKRSLQKRVGVHIAQVIGA